MASQMFMPRHTHPQHRKIKRGIRFSMVRFTLPGGGASRFSIRCARAARSAARWDLQFCAPPKAARLYARGLAKVTRK